MIASNFFTTVHEEIKEKKLKLQQKGESTPKQCRLYTSGGEHSSKSATTKSAQEQNLDPSAGTSLEESMQKFLDKVESIQGYKDESDALMKKIYEEQKETAQNIADPSQPLAPKP